MVKFLIHKPVAVIMVFIALILLGVVAAKHIPVSPLPYIDIPEITVHVSNKNMSAERLEDAVIKNLRAQLQQVTGLDEIHTETRDDYSIIKLRFDYGTDINFAFIEVNEKIDLSMNSFPRDMNRPRVVKASASDIPVFYINLSLRDTVNSPNNASHFLELSEFANQVIKRRLEQLTEIAFVDITGTTSAEVYIQPDVVAMSALSLTEENIKKIIEKNSLVFENVSAMDGILEYNIRFATQNPRTLEEIKNLSFKHNERIFKLKDIAKVGIRQQQMKGTFIANNQAAINLAVIKQPQARLGDLRKAINELMLGFEHDYPDIRFELVRDQTEILEFSINNLKQDLLYGSLLAFIMMFFFLKNVRAPMLIGITIPVCLILSILFFNLFNISINIISLSGLVLGVGLMIDNAIIVIDNITQYRDRGDALSDACVKGATEIIRPLLSSALTTCSVFLPLIFLSGIAGALFYDQAMAIGIGLAISLIVSVTLLPVLYRLFHRGQVTVVKNRFFEKYGITFFERMYEAGFQWVFKNKTASFLIVCVLILSNALLFILLNKEKLPNLKQTEQIIEINWNSNITIDENKNRVKDLVMNLGKNLSSSSVVIGEQQYLLNKEKELSSSESVVYVKSTNVSASILVKKDLKRYFEKKYPEAIWKLNPHKSIFETIFGEDQAPLVVQIFQTGGQILPSTRDVDKVSKFIKDSFPKAEIFVETAQSSLVLNLNSDKLLLYDLSLQSVFDKLKGSLNPNEIGFLQSGQLQIPVVLSKNSTDLNDILRSITVENVNGISYPISDMIKISNERSYKTIQGGVNGNYIQVSVNTKDPDKVINFLNSEFNRKNGMELSFSGSYFSNYRLIKEMGIVLCVAIFLLYFILAAQFESLVQPLIVLFELPISMSGALIMLYFFNSSINLISLIGLVVMCGIIINDSILKIDTINQLRRHKNYSLMDAIHIGGVRRLKSIIMTSMTTILSVSPFLFGSDIGSMLQRPLSLALIGGMIIGTPVSLYFIPLVYWYYYRGSEKKSVKIND